MIRYEDGGDNWWRTVGRQWHRSLTALTNLCSSILSTLTLYFEDYEETALRSGDQSLEASACDLTEPAYAPWLERIFLMRFTVAQLNLQHMQV